MGGVHPEENKRSAGVPTAILPTPETVAIPLAQHIGSPAKPIVARGDKVKVGTLLAESTGFISANIHSSVSGKIKSIDDSRLNGMGFKSPHIVITVDGDEWEETIERSEELKEHFPEDSQVLIETIKQAGIVGMGGATFPTHVKLNIPQGAVAEVLIINAVECEPYLTADHRLLMERGQELKVGIKILMRALQVPRCVVGIEENKPDAIEHFSRLTQSDQDIVVQPLKVRYPQGGEKQLIKAAIGKELPSGALPIQVGAVVQNVGTVFAVYEAVQKNKPLIERVTTVTGKSIPKPSNFWVRIGTPLSSLLEAAGGLPEDTGKIISGGPMMGKAIASVEISVTKGTSGVLALPEKEALLPPTQNCIRCVKCTHVCPMGLEPFLISSLSHFEDWKQAEREDVMDCIECGCCSYICPSSRPLLEYIRFGKNRVGGIIRQRNAPPAK